MSKPPERCLHSVVGTAVAASQARSKLHGRSSPSHAVSSSDVLSEIAAALALRVTNVRLVLIEEINQYPDSTLYCFSPSASNRNRSPAV